MAILDFISKQFIDIIEWTDDSRDTLSFRFPDEDKEIKRGAQLIVRESQVAQFVYLGQFGDTFGPGKYTLMGSFRILHDGASFTGTGFRFCTLQALDDEVTQMIEDTMTPSPDSCG